MVKDDLINRAEEAAGLERWVIRDAVAVLFESVSSALERGDRVVLRRFGMFHAAPRRKGVARNPRTNEPVGIPRGRVVRFRPAPGLRNLAAANHAKDRC
ncbi:MAG: HU family DNA-binding protein [Acidobacteria bacterium]|nr:HU family DNA-binding protein [Acidobacteriota bacterium]